MRLILAFCFYYIVISVQAQNELSGRIIDSLTQAPVPFASVYFANTTIGTFTNDKGEFVFRNFASGKYDLIVSFLGYKTVQTSINFYDTEQHIEILLPQQSTQLDEVIISPDTSHRASDMREFMRTFIGQSRNSAETRILSTKGIHLYFDLQTKELTAASRKPIEIINKALGYKIIYQLESFSLNYASGTQSYFGLPRFEELVAKNNGMKKRWQKERRRAYEGSFTHLINLLQRGILDGPFVIQEFYRVPNRDRPPEEFLKRKIAYWRDRNAGRNVGIRLDGAVTRNDSLGYYIRLRQLPVLKDSIGRTFTKPEELLDVSGKNILYTGMIRVIYKNEVEELAFAQSNRRQPQKIQVSVIHLMGKQLTLYENGYYEDIREVLFEGYMGWQEKISDMLPLGYVSTTDK